VKAVTYTRNGGSDILHYGDVDRPEPGPRDVVVRVEYISIEGGDILIRKVVPPPHSPYIPGYQAAGTIAALGSEVTEFTEGQRVVAFNWSGSHAELMLAPAHYVFAVPDGLDLQLAATIPVAFGTAHDSLFEFGRLQAGETVLIQGAAGGVGIAAVQLAKQAGATVIGTSSSDERFDALQPLGLDQGINYKSEKIGEAARALTGGKGVDLVIDLAGGQSVAELLDAVRYRGRYAAVGASTGDLPSFGLMDLIRKSLTLFGISFGQETHTPRARGIVNSLMEQMAAGKLTMPIDRIFPLAEVRAAHDHVDFGHPLGRVLMRP
jgi:NADPH2:quinone reductase